MKKFLVGCGITIVVALLLLVGAGVWMTRWVQDKMPEMERLSEYERVLAERYGAADDWTPPLDGTYELDRVARFVQIRQSLRPAQIQMAARFDALVASDRPQRKGLSGMIGGAREIVTVLGGGMELLVLADSLLIEAQMGKGEFAHYNLLLVHGVQRASIPRAIDELGGDAEESDAREAMREMLEEYEREARRMLRAHATHALRALDTQEVGPESAAWRELLVEARENASGMLPLTDPVPAGFLAAIAPWQSSQELQPPQSVGEVLAQLPFVLSSDEQQSGNVRIRF